MEQDVYLKERASLVEGGQAGADQHDKAMLTLSAGALALSLTFLEKIAPHPAPCTSWLALIAWICFIFCITCVLISFHLSQKAFQVQIKILDDILRAAIGSALVLPSDYYTQEIETKNKYGDWVTKFNVASLILFILGVSCFTIFAWVNFPEGQ